MDTSVSFAKNHTCILYQSSVVLPWEFILSVSNFNSEAFLLSVKFKQLLDNYNNLMHELKGGPIQYPHKYHTMWQQSWEKIINISNILDEYLEEFSRLNP
jgi:hypothetical protein